MDKIIGICNLHDDPKLGVLTDSRPCGAVTFLGRYGLIDFTLSNFSNSGIDQVYVLVKNGVTALRNHIGNGSIWTNNTKLGHLSLLFSEEYLATPKFNTDLLNMKNNLHVDELDFDYAVIAPSFMLASIDYRPIVEAHKESEADITIVYSVIEDTDEEFTNCDALKIGLNNKVSEVETNLGKGKKVNISLESFIINKKALQKILNDYSKVSELYSLRQMISYYVNKDRHLDIRAYKFDGYVVPMLTLDHYVYESFKLLSYHNRNKLFLPDWPIYTTTHNTPPALYDKTADVTNSFIANGAVIKGKVTNSIISRGVTIEKGAELTNCIIFTSSKVGKDVKMQFVVTDKNANISTIKELKGEPSRILYIKQGAKI